MRRSSPGTRSFARPLGVVLALLVLVGCGSFPTEGPIQQASQTQPSGRPPGIDVAAQPPAPGASPEAVLEGFFSASESPGDSYLVARQYLTPEAAGSWNPETGITVYDATGQSRAVTTEGSAVLQAPVVGRLNADHVFTALHEPKFSHNFEMVQVDGEWRIANPGSGVLMSVQRFARAFEPVPVYYLDPVGQRMVAQQVFLRPGLVTPDGLVRTLLAGPGTWLRQTALNALPPELQSSGTTVDERGVATVNLSDEMEALSVEQRVQVAAQLLYTLRYFDHVNGLQILVNGRLLPVRGADSGGVVRMAAVQYLTPDRAAAPRTLFAITGGLVVTVDETTGQFTPVAGPLGSGWDNEPAQLAVSWQSDRLGLVDRGGQQLFWAMTADGNPNPVHSGTALVRPQFDVHNRLWCIDNTPAGPVAVRVTDGQVRTIPIPELAGATVLAFRLSSDMTRMAVVTRVGDQERLGLLRLRGPEAEVLDGWRELPINTSRGFLTDLRDVTFSATDRLVVIGAAEREPQFGAYTLDIDAAAVISQGPVSDVDPVRVTAMPSQSSNALALVSANGRVLRYEAQYRWPELAQKVTELAYPS